MRSLVVTVAATLLVACRATAPAAVATPPVRAGMVTAATEPGRNAQAARPVLTNEVLTAVATTATLKADTSLLQRPKTGSVQLKTLLAGDTVQILGNLDNADGQWISVGVGDTQGWVRAAQVTP